MSFFPASPKSRWPVALLGCALTVTGGYAAAEPFATVVLRPGERQLFLDDFILGDLDQVERVIHQPRKFAGNPILRPDRPTDGATIQIRDAPSWDEREGVWKLWYFRMGDDGNGAGGCGFARSKDGIQWEKPNLGLVESHGSRNNNLTLVKDDPKAFIQHVIIVGLPNYFESSGRIPPPRGNQDGINSPKLSCSRNLLAWTRVGDRSHFIPISPVGPGVLDTGQIMASSHPIRRGDELWFYYSGIDVRHRPNIQRVRDEYRWAIHLAKLRVDGFVSLRAGSDGGSIETRSVVLDGGRLFVNAATGAGEIRAAIMERDGRTVVPGWSLDQCTAVTGDRVRVELRWAGRDLAELRNRKVRIRFRLTNADIYSFWIEP